MAVEASTEPATGTGPGTAAGTVAGPPTGPGSGGRDGRSADPAAACLAPARPATPEPTIEESPAEPAVEARTRLWRDGNLELEGFPMSQISDYVDTPGALVWLDLHQPDVDDLAVLSEEFGLHPLAIEDATTQHQRPKLDRYSDHVFLNLYAVRVDDETGVVHTSEISAFVLPHALITVRKAGGLPVEKLLERWDGAPALLTHGPGALVHGLIDLAVDGHFAAIQTMDDLIEDLEEAVFSDEPLDLAAQRQSFGLRKSLSRLRRVVLPMREVVNALMRRELDIVDDTLSPYYQDVYDHVLRVTEWTESLRDLVSTIRETNLTLQGNRLNEIMKKLTGWAAIIAVPTAVTGFFGQNVPYPGFGSHDGFYASVVIMLAIGAALYVMFKHRDWL